MARASWLVLAGTIALAGGSALLAPNRAITPGTLETGHATLERSCFACHQPFRGAPRERCVTCHATETIGMVFSTGAARSETKPKSRELHRLLAERECVACHVGHRGWGLDAARRRFAHEVLPAAAREACTSCHETERPDDMLHRSAPGSCGTCHRTERWKPASYDHDRFFRFDRDHPSRCADCHPSAPAPSGVAGLAYDRYSCTGCHEHRWDRMLAEHREEGIVERDLATCARCHRSAAEHDGGRGRDGHRAESDDDD